MTYNVSMGTLNPTIPYLPAWDIDNQCGTNPLGAHNALTVDFKGKGLSKREKRKIARFANSGLYSVSGIMFTSVSNRNHVPSLEYQMV